jgi:competence protein ComEC
LGPYLWRSGIRRVDRLLLTHAHFDHVAAAPFLVRTFRPREVWEGLSAKADRAAEILETTARAAGANRLCVRRGVAGTWDGVEVEVLWPEGRSRPTRVENDQSVVVRLRFADVCLFLAGDVGTEVERRLGATRCQVVKIPHHGSRSSSSQELVHRLGARVALLSVGRGRTGFPSAEVVERYAREGALLLRTDRDGAILVSTDGARVWVRTEREGRERRVL